MKSRRAKVCARRLEDRYDVYVAEDAAAAMSLLEQENFDVLLTDFRLPNEDGMKLIARAKSLPKPPDLHSDDGLWLGGTGGGGDETAARTIISPRAGCKLMNWKCASRARCGSKTWRRKMSRCGSSSHTKFGLENIIGESPAMQEVFELVRQVAPTRATVLIRGESGTGKELIAKAIHQLSPRAKQPMVTVHCAALVANACWKANCSATKKAPSPARTSGASDGSSRRRAARCSWMKSARSTRPSQVKLLRFLGERTFERVGSNKTSDRRCAVGRGDQQESGGTGESGTFREDLFFRLRVVEIDLPPLRERNGDIPLLAQSFLREFAKENDKPVKDIHAGRDGSA